MRGKELYFQHNRSLIGVLFSIIHVHAFMCARERETDMHVGSEKIGLRVCTYKKADLCETHQILLQVTEEE